MYGAGCSREGEIIDLGVAQGFVAKAGAWYSYNGDRIGQGKQNAIQYLAERPELAQEIEASIRQKLMPHLADAKASPVETKPETAGEEA